MAFGKFRSTVESRDAEVRAYLYCYHDWVDRSLLRDLDWMCSGKHVSHRLGTCHFGPL